MERDLFDVVREYAESLDEGEDAVYFSTDCGDVEEDCPMDGDAQSALASCGWGMDEDYGGDGYGWEDYW